MSGALPLLGAPGPDAAVAWHHGAAVSAAAFQGAVERLAARLPAARSALLLCEDRVYFALALCACATAGVEALLPPSRAVAAIDDVVDRHGPGFALVDRESPLRRLPACVVDERFATRSPFTASAIPADRVVATLFTSGTTGAPAPHRKTWGSLVRGALALAERLQFAYGEVVVGAVPSQHMWGLEATVMLPLAAGGVLHPALPLLPHDVAHCLREAPAPRWLVLTPIHVRACLRAHVSLPALAGALCATAPLDPQEARDFEACTGAPLIEIYGSTETGVAGTRRAAQESTFRLLGKLEAVDSAMGTTFRGGHLDAEVRLKDRIRRLADQRFELAGRDEDLVKIAGKRASLCDLTLMLKRLPGVLDAVCLLDKMPGSLTPRLAALVVAPGLDARTIRVALRERVDPVFLPRPLHVVDKLPRNPVGKLRREEIERLMRDLDGSELEGEAPA